MSKDKKVEEGAKVGRSRKKGRNSAFFKNHPATGSAHNGPLSRAFLKLNFLAPKGRRAHASLREVEAALKSAPSVDDIDL